MSLHDWIEILGPTGVGLVAFFVRHGWRRVEKRAAESERTREKIHALEQESLKNMVAALHEKVALEKREREALRQWFVRWSTDLRRDFAAQIKLHGDEVEHLNRSLAALVKFLDVEVAPGGQSAKVGKDVYVIRRTKTKLE